MLKQIPIINDAISQPYTFLLGIPGFPPGMPYPRFCQNFFFFFFLFFRRQGFQMITFDRQARILTGHISWS